jgi:hypothetical protein
MLVCGSSSFSKSSLFSRFSLFSGVSLFSKDSSSHVKSIFSQSFSSDVFSSSVSSQDSILLLLSSSFSIVSA